MFFFATKTQRHEVFFLLGIEKTFVDLYYGVLLIVETHCSASTSGISTIVYTAIDNGFATKAQRHKGFDTDFPLPFMFKET